MQHLNAKHLNAKHLNAKHLNAKHLNIIFLLLSFALLTSCSLLPPQRLYVDPTGNDLGMGSKKDPLRSIEKARERVKEIRQDDPGRDIVVVLGKGTWQLSQALEFGPADGGSEKSRVIWEGDPEGGTIVSGGIGITGFQDAGYGIWWAPVDTSHYFEQLYVDTLRAVRARTPDVNDSMPRFYLGQSEWIYNPDSSVAGIRTALNDYGQLQCLMTGDRFEAVIFKDWTISRFHVGSLQSDPPSMILKPPFALFEGPYNSIFAPSANRYSCFLEGDPSFISEPGEWALDQASARLYYKPLPGQTPENCVVTAPRTSQLIRISGTSEKKVKNLHFKGIRFMHAGYRLPDFNHDGMQAGYYYPGNTDPSGRPGLVDPAIRLVHAEGCSFSGCDIKHAGGNGIYLSEGCTGNLISDCRISDIGANGIMIGLTYDPAEQAHLLPKDNRVLNSDVYTAGVSFHGSVGIWLGFCAGSEVNGCHVYDLPYTGISVGWQWNPLPTSARENRILNNHIHQVMQMLGDGGGIYTLGFQPGSVLAGNEIHDILRSELNHASDNNGMFIDEGSKGYRIENNTIRNTAHTCIRGHRAAGVEVTGNTFYGGGKPAISHTPPYHAMIFANQDTVIRWPNPGWPKEWGYADTVEAFVLKNNKYLK